MRIRDLGWKKIGSGINIPDPQHCVFGNLCIAVLISVPELDPDQAGFVIHI